MTLPGGVYDTFSRGGGQSEDNAEEHPKGLRTLRNDLVLNGRPIRIVSGAIHYFRVHPHYWSDRLAKLRAAGCICVET